MGKRLWTLGTLSAVLVAAVLVAVILHRRAVAADAAAPDVDEFLRVRQSTYSVLQRQIAAPLEGVQTPEPLDNMPNPFPGESYIQQAVHDTGWSNACSFGFRLELDESVLPPAQQGNSETMAAAVLLNHYFLPLETSGFRRIQSGGGMGGMVQSARKIWISDEAKSLVVEGTVFVSLASKEAIVQGTIHERIDRQ